MADTVRDLQPGHLVIGDGDMGTAVHIANTSHPIWPTLRLVIWRLDDGTLSLDALSPDQHVGTIALSTADGRASRLREALLRGES